MHSVNEWTSASGESEKNMEAKWWSNNTLGGGMFLRGGCVPAKETSNAQTGNTLTLLNPKNFSIA